MLWTWLHLSRNAKSSKLASGIEWIATNSLGRPNANAGHKWPLCITLNSSLETKEWQDERVWKRHWRRDILSPLFHLERLHWESEGLLTGDWGLGVWGSEHIFHTDELKLSGCWCCWGAVFYLHPPAIPTSSIQGQRSPRGLDDAFGPRPPSFSTDFWRWPTCRQQLRGVDVDSWEACVAMDP